MANQEDRQNNFCVGCRTRSPETETEYTLISSRFGWRLTRRIDKDGAFLMEWRCPNCWQKYKAERQLLTTPSEGNPVFRDEIPPSTPRRSPSDPSPPSSVKKK
jgi:hypothetical protein